MLPPLSIRFSLGQVAALERHYERTPKPAERTRSHINLVSHQRYSPPAIATVVSVHRRRFRRTVHRYERGGLRGLLALLWPGAGPPKVTRNVSVDLRGS